MTLEAVLYGALRGRRQIGHTCRAPVFDLSRFVSLLDWLTAADRFVQSSGAPQARRHPARSPATPVPLAAAAGNRQAQQMATALKGAATAMENVALPLRLTRPVETVEAAATLDQALAAAQAAFDQWAPPFALVRAADEVRGAYAKFGLAEPLSSENLAQIAYGPAPPRRVVPGKGTDHSGRHVRPGMAGVVDHGLAGRAAVGQPSTPANSQLRRGHRGSPAARRAQTEQNQTGETEAFFSTFLRNVPELERILDLFSRLGEVRNDLNHAGLREGEVLTKTLASRTGQLSSSLPAYRFLK